MAKAKTEKEAVFAHCRLTDPAERQAAAEAMAARRATAREVIADAACRVGDEAISAIVLPTIERVMGGDLQIVDLHAGAGSGLVKVVRSKGLHYRLARLGLCDDLIAVALRFNKAFERARIGNLTACYDVAGGGNKAGDQERFVGLMRELAAASHGPVSCPLTQDERVVLYGYVLMDISMADVGHYVARAVSPEKKMHQFTGKLLLHKALEKLVFFYEDLDHRADQALKAQKRA